MSEKLLRGVVERNEYEDYGILLKALPALRMLWADGGVREAAARGPDLFHLNASAS